MVKSTHILPVFLIISSAAVGITKAFVVLPSYHDNSRTVRLPMAKEDAKGYRFGDITRGFLKKVQEDTGSSSYKFGDISRWLDKKAKEQVSKFTKKENYEFGDMTKEIVRRFKDGEYTRDDLLLFLKIVATIGINIQPVTSVLPLKVLTDLLNMVMEASIAQSVGERVATAITNEIDARMKEMVTGDRNYQLGDITKRSLAKWTGKENYEIGDITKTLLEKRAAASDGTEKEEVLELFTSESEEDLLKEWDEKFLKERREKEGLGGLNDNDEQYRDWDEKFLSSSSTSN